MNNFLNMMADRGRKYLTYVMALMGIATIIGLFIPVTSKFLGVPVAAKPVIAQVTFKAILILALCVAFIIASQLKQFWAAPAVVIALVVMILVGSCGGAGLGGGIAIMRTARVFMFVFALLNTGLLLFKEFVLDKKAQ